MARLPVSVGRLYAQALHQYANELAVTDGDTSLTYSELKVAVAHAIVSFREHGLEPGRRIGLAMGMSADFVVLYVAAQIAGLTVVELNPLLDASMLSYRVRVAELDAVWVKVNHLSADALETLDGLSCRQINADSLNLKPDASFVHSFECAEINAPAAINFTSGSTGMPKAIAMSSAAIATQILLALSSVNHPATPVCLLTMTHPTVMHMLLSPTLLRGGQVVTLNNADLEVMVETASKYRANFLFFPTRVLYQLLDKHPTEWMKSQVELCYYGGENMTDERLKEALDRCGQVFVQAYGMAETSPVALLKPEDHDPSRSQILQSIGRPMIGCGIEIRNQDGEVLPCNHPGKMFLKTPCAMDGYVGMPEKTNETLVNGWVDTGDIGFMDDQGYFYLLDREKFSFTIGDRTLYPRMVEMCLAKSPAVATAVASGLMIDGETRLFVTVQEKVGCQIDQSQLRKLVSEAFGIELYRVLVLQCLPLNPVSKKIDREKLVEMFLLPESGSLNS